MRRLRRWIARRPHFWRGRSRICPHFESEAEAGDIGRLCRKVRI